MASDLAPLDILQVTVSTKVVAQVCLSVFHYRISDIPVGTTYEDGINSWMGVWISDAVTGMVATGMANVMAPNCEFTNVRAQRVYPTRDYYIDFPQSGTGNWGGGNATTANVSVVINKQSSRSGRGRHGSLHIPGVPSDGYDNGVITVPYRTACDALANLVDDPYPLTVGSTNRFFPGMYHPGLGVDNNWSSIIRAATQSTVRVMRRRTVGLGI